MSNLSQSKSDRIESIYFIAIVPPEPILSEVKAFKDYANAHFDSSRALRAPAHVTLLPPFKYPDDSINALKSALTGFGKTYSRFPLALRDFAAFAPRVIYVDLVSNPILYQLQDHLKSYLQKELNIKSDRPERPFHPHMTVAFKDLRKDRFDNAWSYFSSIKYERRFDVGHLSLLRHQNRSWKVLENFALQPA